MHVCLLTSLDDSIGSIRQIIFHLTRVIYAMVTWSIHHTWNTNWITNIWKNTSI